MDIKVYTDGACHGNPGGPGGWGYFMQMSNGSEVRNCGGEKKTTNNRMELMAAIKALESLKGGDVKQVVVYSDSKYVVQGISSWINGWKRNGWKSASKQPVLNQDLWKQLDAARSDLTVRFEHVPGHSGIPGNEEADRLANQGLQQANPSRLES